MEIKKMTSEKYCLYLNTTPSALKAKNIEVPENKRRIFERKNGLKRK
jgi:hypothetical protein